MHAELARHCDAARRHRPQDSALSGISAWMALNGAYLIRAERGADLAGLVDSLRDRYPALRLELTGPWPPYSFAVLDKAAGEDAAAGDRASSGASSGGGR